MARWEYKKIGIKRLNDIDELNKCGSEGWELIYLIADSLSGGYKGIMKRELINQ
jgi:hypothetical protein